MDARIIALWMVGIGTLGLGIVHLVMPRLADVQTAVGSDGPPLRPLPLVGGRYTTRRRDVLGVVWVSNNAASYVLLTLGSADLLASAWIATDAGRWLALWATGWWVTRTVSQLAFGRRSGDLLLMVAFAFCAAAHLAVVA